MDADGSHDVAVIPALIRAIRDDGNELAVGSRYIRGGGIRDWPLHRVIISRVAVLMATPLTRVKDITSGFFFFQRRIIDGVHLNPIGFKIGLEVFVKARYSRFCEVPYTFTDRVQGKSKLSGKVIWQYLLQLCNLIAYRISTLCCRC